MKNIYIFSFFLLLALSSCGSTDSEDSGGTVKKQTDYLAIATTGVNNLIKNFWTSDGIRPTWGGIDVPSTYSDKLGQIWERAMMIYPMYQLYKLNGDATLLAKLNFEANRLKTKYDESKLLQPAFYYNTALDDCGWNAQLYMIFYDITKDVWFMNIAKQLIDNAIARWSDTDGSLFYRDNYKVKALYAVTIVSAMLDIYDVTQDQTWLNKAKAHYAWIVSLLGRSDGLYWVEANASGPVGKNDPNKIAEGGSVSFLAGNQAMCVIEKRLYEIDKDANHLTRIKKTTLALSTIYNLNGIFLNDRDAWTNGTFMCQYARMIASDPNLKAATADMLLATARSIAVKDITSDGYYGGSWEGPAGSGSVWTDGGSVPQQITTSGSTVQVLVAAAILNSLK